ncbi:hypothetical protein FG386_000486 [Cryptosporidium ryanae]|uniref:uncharacterized protein n=1 Tax=Cryptosporidium ryanae TaxID=515981 RepID=UPI00351A5A81|nr:hypothetical protein FG386_000486 [Cryptosporidium ryanae]
MGNIKKDLDSKPLIHKEVKTSRAAIVMVMLAFIQMIVSSGIMLGWQSLANVIKSSGKYRFLCDDPSLPCMKEEVYLANLMSTVISIQMFLVIFLGILMDFFGPKFMGVCQTFSALGTFMIAYGNPQGSIDYIWYGTLLQNICGCVYIPSFIHLANLFPNRRAFVASTISTLYGFSSLTFLVVQLAYDNLSISMSNALLPLGIIQASFVVYNLLLPNSTIQIGDKCGFSLQKLGFYVIKDNNNGDKIENNSNSSICEVKEDSDSKSIISSKIVPLYNKIFSKLFLVQFSLELFLIISVNFYVSTLSLQIEEISGLPTEKERKDIGHFWSTIFTFITPFGSIFGVLEGLFVDKFGLWKSALVPATFLISCSLLKLVPSVPAQLLTFIAYTSSQESFFSAAYSLFAIAIPTNIICTFVGINLLLQSFPVGYFAKVLVSFVTDKGWSFRNMNTMLAFPAIIVSVVYVKFLYSFEKKNSENNKSNVPKNQNIV